jgi:predicted CoA-binding protein
MTGKMPSVTREPTAETAVVSFVDAQLTFDKKSTMNSIERFLAARTYAVAGASNRRHKYGNKVFRALLAADRETYPLNPAQEEIEGHQAYPSIADLPLAPEALSIITPPEVTRKVVADAIVAGVQHIWMQPGAEDEQASESARKAGVNVIDDGSCILVLLAR